MIPVKTAGWKSSYRPCVVRPWSAVCASGDSRGGGTNNTNHLLDAIEDCLHTYFHLCVCLSHRLYLSFTAPSISNISALLCFLSLCGSFSPSILPSSCYKSFLFPLPSLCLRPAREQSGAWEKVQYREEKCSCTWHVSLCTRFLLNKGLKKNKVKKTGKAINFAQTNHTRWHRVWDECEILLTEHTWQHRHTHCHNKAIVR